MKHSLTLAVAATALTAVLSGCGGSSYSSSSSAAAPTASTAASTGSSGGAYGGGGASTAASGSSAKGVSVTVKHDKLGSVLAAGPKRLTVYLFEGDHGSVSACSGACAKVWPPLTSAGAATAGAGAKASDIAMITRSDGTQQVTYKGHPLYYFATDKDAGDTYGEGVKSFGADWYALSPSGAKIDKS